MRKEWEMDAIDSLAWLQDLAIYPKIYWASRDQNVTIAAAGIGTEDYSVERFGWRFFNNTRSFEWRDFPPSFFFNPRFIVTRKNKKYFFVENSEDPQLTHLTKNQKRSATPQCRIQKMESLPTHIEWNQLIHEALQAIRHHHFEKVVLARRLKLECSTTIDPIALCQSINSANRTIFLIQPTPTSTFIGASPETLYRRQGQAIVCDVLAGTRPIHRIEELLHSEKDLREFKIVQNRIIDALSDLCIKPPTSSMQTIRSTSQVGHLYSQIFGLLNDQATDEILFNALHPTPAVGGHPTQKALSFIAAKEPFARGLYAAPIGWTAPGEAEFAVGIRSCLIQENRAYLYAGTGIVEGSDPELEWEESEHKLAEWKRLFHE